MDKVHIEEKEIIKVNNKEYMVTTKTIDNPMKKEDLIKLIVEYSIQNLEQDNMENENL